MATSVSVFFWFLLACMLVLGSGTAARAGSGDDSQGDSLEREFQNRKAGVERMVDEGRLEKAAGERAREISILLKKDLIQNAARIQTLKLEATEYSGERRQQALDGLVHASEERSLIYLKYLSALEELSGGVPPEVADPVHTAEPAPTKKKTVTIEFKGEDLTTEPPALE